MNTVVRLVVVLLSLSGVSVLAESLKVGVPLALTGDQGGLGNDMKNAILIGKELLEMNDVEFVFEDDKCSGQTSVSVAHKLTAIDKVDVVLGVSCNAALLPSVAIYRRAGIPVLTSSATTGDVTGVGPKVFRLFPADQGASEALFKYLKVHTKKIAILTEQDEFTALLQRHFLRLNSEAGSPLSIVADEVGAGTRDIKSVALGLLRSKPEVLFVNTTTDPTFVMYVKEIRNLGISIPIVAAYYPASPSVLKELGNQAEGVRFANLPALEGSFSDLGRRFNQKFIERFGPPYAGPTVVPFTFEAVRLLHRAHSKGVDLDVLLRGGDFGESSIGAYQFDSDGAVSGIAFEMQEIRNGKPVSLVDSQ